MLDHDIKNLKEGENSNIRLKVKWEKVDIDLYKALTDQSIDAYSLCFASSMRIAFLRSFLLNIL
jgi:hypothetical protein